MSTQAKKRLALVGAVISLVVAALVVPGLVGRTARLVDLIALFASGVAGGASIATAVALSKRK